MADPQSEIFIRDGRAYVAVDHLNNVLASAPDNPSQAIIGSTPGPEGRLQWSLQLQPTQGAHVGDDRRAEPSGNLERHSDDTHQHGSNKQTYVQRSSIRQNIGRGFGPYTKAAHDIGYQDAHLLLDQLKSLQPYDEDTLKQLQTNPLPPALSELSKAEGSLVPLATSNDGRVFALLVGSPAKSYWEGDSRLNSERPHRGGLFGLTYPKIAYDPITSPQVEFLKQTLTVIEDSLSGYNLTASVEVLWPEFWKAVPSTDRTTCRHEPHQENFNDMKYQTVAQFMMDVELLRDNTVTSFGHVHVVSIAARRVYNFIFFEMVDYSTTTALMKPRTPSAARKPKQEWLQRGPLREICYRDSMDLLSEQQGSDHPDYPQFVIPLGRVCVVQSLNEQSRNDRVWATRQLVVMDIASPHKALWLIWDYFTVSPDSGRRLWLAQYQFELLKANGKDVKALSRLTDDIKRWDVGSNGDGGNDSSFQLSRKKLLDWDVPDGAEQKKALVTGSSVGQFFDCIWNQQILETIKQG